MKDVDEERSAILAVIDAETEAYLQRDYDGWQKCWHDGPEIQRIHTHVGTGVTVVTGADVRMQMHRLLTENSDWQVPDAILRENIKVVVSAEMAWVTYDQTGDMSSIPKELSGHYHELKILHKIDGSWKIACIVGTQLRLEHVRAPLIEVAVDARLLWMNEAAQNRLPEHPLLGLRADHLNAAEPEAQHEVLDALKWLSQVRDRHTTCVGGDAVTRAIALGQDDAGLAHICWAILRDGKLLITFDDTDRLEQQLNSAAEVYGLSQNQERLVRELFDGHGIASAAKILGISPNTAKTHLQRIYDKTGVRSQTALVRLLLNADRQGV